MNRRGFTLVEVVMALLILAVVFLSLGRFVGSFLHSVGTASARTIAAAVAQEQMETIKTDPTYPLPASWAGTVTGFPGYTNMRRITALNRVTGANPSRDYTVVTVKVTEPTMRSIATAPPDTVNISFVVARP
jgi:prepilin-type N-terminal cleavage/methylation domain-containing protein